MSGITLYFSSRCLHSRRFLPIFKKFKKIYCGGAKIKMINISDGNFTQVPYVPCVVCKLHSMETSVAEGNISLKKLQNFIFQNYDKKIRVRVYLYLQKINKLNYQLEKYIIQRFL